MIERADGQRPSFLDSVRALRDRRLRHIFLLGIASGFPWLLIGSAMTAWLKDAGLTRSAIGLFGAAFVCYTINFLWAPIVDHLRLPLLGQLGQRRSWILLCQCLLMGFTLLLTATGPGSHITVTALLVLGIAAASATQDLAIDAYRIAVIRENEPELIGHGAAMATCGWWTGASLPGVFAFWLREPQNSPLAYLGITEPLSWSTIYLGLAAVLLPISLLVLWLFREPPRPTAVVPDLRHLGRWINETYLDAVAEFFRRNGVSLAFGLLAFIFLFKIGEAFLGRMIIVFYKEVGFGDADIGTYSKGLGLVVTFACSVVAGVFASRFGVVRGLFFAGIAMAATNLLFSWIAVAGPDTRLLFLAVVADGITSAFSTVAFVAFISYYTSHLHTATQYGALASLGNSSRTLLAASSGMLVDALGGVWTMFFVLTALMVLPSLGILAWISGRANQTG